MRTRLMLLAALLGVAVWAFGCGGTEYTESAQQAKPYDIGTADEYDTGATKSKEGDWIVKADIGGEVRLYVLSNKVIAPVDKGGGMGLQFDSEKNQFYDQGRKHVYDLQGNALFNIPNGNPAPALGVRPIALDKENGHIMVTGFKVLSAKDRENESAGAYIVVQ